MKNEQGNAIHSLEVEQTKSLTKQVNYAVKCIKFLFTIIFRCFLRTLMFESLVPFPRTQAYVFDFLYKRRK